MCNNRRIGIGTLRGLRCRCCESPFSPEPRLCVDPGAEGAQMYKEKCRDDFWPLFTHPTWLCCRTLYGCCCRSRVRRPRDFEDD